MSNFTTYEHPTTGDSAPRVSSFLSFAKLDSEAYWMEKWVKKVERQTCFNHLGDLVRLALENTTEDEVLHRFIRSQPEDTYKRDLGTAAHDAVERYLRGEEQPIAHDTDGGVIAHDDVQPFLEQFIAWWEDLLCTDRANLIHNEVVAFGDEYAGTIDLVVSIDGEVWIIDIK